jgi:hypothetical protein
MTIGVNQDKVINVATIEFDATIFLNKMIKTMELTLILMSSYWWRVKDLNLRRQSRGIYSPNQGQTLAQHSQISRGK